MSRQPHTLVIGAGVVGFASAAALVRRDHAVTLVDRSAPGQGCSYGNAGCFSLASIVPVGMPGMWRKVPGWLLDPSGPLSIPARYAPRVAPWVWKLLRNSNIERVQQIADDLQTLLGPTFDYWKPLAKWAGCPELIQQNGWAVVYESEQALSNDSLGWKLRAERGIRIELLGRDAIREFEPALASKFTHMAFLPEQGQCSNPFRLSKALESTLLHHGARFVNTGVKDFVIRDGRIAAIETEGGQIEADNVIIAAGAHSKSLAAKLGNAIPLDTERGYHAMVHTQTLPLTRPIMSGEGKFFATPMEGGVRFAGSVELGGLRIPPNYRRADILLKKGKAMLPDLDCAEATQWIGFRPSLPTASPSSADHVAPITRFTLSVTGTLD